MACCMSLAQCGKGGLSAAKAGFRAYPNRLAKWLYDALPVP